MYNLLPFFNNIIIDIHFQNTISEDPEVISSSKQKLLEFYGNIEARYRQKIAQDLQIPDMTAQAIMEHMLRNYQAAIANLFIPNHRELRNHFANQDEFVSNFDVYFKEIILAMIQKLFDIAAQELNGNFDQSQFNTDAIYNRVKEISVDYTYNFP